jgi:hypothetical protein
MTNGNGAELTSGAAAVSTATLADGIVGVPLPGVPNDALVFVCHRVTFAGAIGILSAYIDSGTLVIESTSSADQSVVNYAVFFRQTIAMPPPPLPAAPTGVHYDSQDVLDWDPNPNPQVWFELEQNFQRVDEWTPTVTTPRGVTTISGLDEDGDISHRIRAVDSGVQGPWAYPAPKTPDSLLVDSFVGNSSRAITWFLKGANPEGSTGVEVQRKISGGGGDTWATLQTLPAGTQSTSDIQDVSANEGDDMSYRVRELSSFGNSGWSNIESGVIQ